MNIPDRVHGNWDIGQRNDEKSYEAACLKIRLQQMILLILEKTPKLSQPLAEAFESLKTPDK